jgi:hypothetical protein
MIGIVSSVVKRVIALSERIVDAPIARDPNASSRLGGAKTNLAKATTSLATRWTLCRKIASTGPALQATPSVGHFVDC